MPKQAPTTMPITIPTVQQIDRAVDALLLLSTLQQEDAMALRYHHGHRIRRMFWDEGEWLVTEERNPAPVNSRATIIERTSSLTRALQLLQE